MGIVDVARLSATIARIADPRNDIQLETDQLNRQRGKPLQARPRQPLGRMTARA
jgi:hypothetical protein